MFKLWVMNNIVMFNFCCRDLSKFKICVCIEIFNVVVGLLVISSLGLLISVMVIIICCCLLFESLCG